MKYRIGDVSKMLHISDQMIRYYEKNGVIHPERSGDGQYRLYSEMDVFLLFEAMKYKEWDISIPEINDMISNDYYTTLIELFWSKERILEVYLNIAETGRGLFGVEAACNRYFSCSTSDISISDAAALACVLPKPLARTPSLVLTHHANKHSKIAQQVGQNLSLNKQ